MKRIIGVVTVATAALALAGTATALVPSGPPQTTNAVFGTPGDDVVHGTFQSDRIATFAGDDVVWGHQRRDRINAGSGKDVVRGGRGNDWIVGQADGDLDVINCGRGRFDVVTEADPQDQINANCEEAPEQGGPPVEPPAGP